MKQLTAEEARFLDKAYEEATIGAKTKLEAILAANPNFKNVDPQAFGLSGTLIKNINPILVENMERLNLVTRVNVPLTIDDSQITNIMPPANHLYVSELGKAFVRACRIPKADGHV